MPNEFHFDDLDLREEPALRARAEAPIYSNPPVQQGEADIFTTTHACCV